MGREKIFRKRAKKHSNELSSSSTVFAQKKLTDFNQPAIVEDDEGESGGGQGKRLLGFYKKEKIQRLVGKKFKIKDFLPFLNREKMADEVTKSPVSKDSKKNAEQHEQAKLAEEAEKRIAERLEDGEVNDDSIAVTRNWGKDSSMANAEVNIAAQAFGRSLEGAFANATINPLDTVLIAGQLKAHAMFGSTAPGAITHGTINPLGFATLETIANGEAARQRNAKFINTNAAMLRQKNTTFVNANAAAARQKNATFTHAQTSNKNTPSASSGESSPLSAKTRR